MFTKIFSYEFTSWLKKPSFYLYLIVFWGISFLAFIGTGGLFDGPEPAVIQNPQFINSPFQINSFFQYFNKLFLFLLPTIIGATIYKDYKNNVHSILYSFPIEKSSYIAAKFFSSFLITCIIVCFVAFSFLLGEGTPGVYTKLLGEFQPIGYIQALFVYTIPNMLFFGTIVFSVVIYFRNIYAGFIVIIGLFFLQNISQNIFGSNGYLIALFDPFAENTVAFLTQFWTLEDKNSLFIPVLGVVLYNRILWLAISSLIFGFVYKKFEFNEQPIVSFQWKKRNKTVKKEKLSIVETYKPLKVSYKFSFKEKLKNTWKLSNTFFAFIIKNWMFYVVAFLGIVAVLFTIGRITNNSSITILPTTNVVLTVPAFFFTVIIMLLTFIYSGMLLHRERNSNMNQLVDASAITNWQLLFAKLFAIIKMQITMLIIMMIVGISIQAYNGYYLFELDQYVFRLFAMELVGLVIWAFASICIHSFLKNTYLGIFALILLWLGVQGVKEMGITSKLILFNFHDPLLYSDISGYRNQLIPFFFVKAYWFLVGILSLIISYLFWMRGMDHSMKERLQFVKLRFDKKVKIVATLSILSTILVGFSIHREENKINFADNSKQKEALQSFVQEFGSYQNLSNQPKITDVDIALDVYPSQNDFTLKGSYLLQNKSDQNIDTLLIKTGFDEISNIDLDIDYRVIDKSEYIHFYVLKLEESLVSGESIRLSFDIQNKKNTLFEKNSNVIDNGTFLKQDILPRIGYFLNNKPLNPSNQKAGNNPLGVFDADKVGYNAVVSTSDKQTIITQGSLQKEWKDNNRNYYHYQSDGKIKFNFSFISAEFIETIEVYKDIEITIFHHKAHIQNIDRMMNGLKAAIDYNTQYFSQYPYKEIKVIEFPMSEGVFATIMANTIPTSERRFISSSNFSTDEFFDPAFKVQAHELTHHWWGNTLIHGNALGASMLSESITDYITLRIYEQKFGKESGNRFKKLQRNRYLKGRISEVANEAPLYLSKSSDVFLSYGKGSLVFNTLAHYLGEKKLNGILNDFLNKYKADDGKYPTSLDLLTELKREVPDSLQYYIKDQFEDIIFYDSKINTASIISSENNFKVEVDFEISKHRKNNTEKLIPNNEYIELGFYDEENKIIKIETLKIDQINNKQKFSFSEKPFKVVIDPNLLLLQKAMTKNSKTIN